MAEEGSSHKDVRGPGRHDLDIFSWIRVVYDECSYKNSLVSCFVANVVGGSDSCSAIPSTRNITDLYETVYMLGCHLAYPEPNILPCLSKVTSCPAKEGMTESEIYRSAGSLKSLVWVAERHQQAIRFVRHFYRCNILDEGSQQVIRFVRHF